MTSACVAQRKDCGGRTLQALWSGAQAVRLTASAPLPDSPHSEFFRS